MADVYSSRIKILSRNLVLQSALAKTTNKTATETGERERERERQTDRQTDRDKQRQTQTGRQTETEREFVVVAAAAVSESYRLTKAKYTASPYSVILWLGFPPKHGTCLILQKELPVLRGPLHLAVCHLHFGQKASVLPLPHRGPCRCPGAIGSCALSVAG